MLNIYSVSLLVVRDVALLAGSIARFDRDLARQLRRSMASVPLNLAEGSGGDGGKRRQRYQDALGSAREALATLEVAAALGYVAEPKPELRRRFDHIIGVLVRNVYSAKGARAKGLSRTAGSIRTYPAAWAHSRFAMVSLAEPSASLYRCRRVPPSHPLAVRHVERHAQHRPPQLPRVISISQGDLPGQRTDQRHQLLTHLVYP